MTEYLWFGGLGVTDTLDPTVWSADYLLEKYGDTEITVRYQLVSQLSPEFKYDDGGD